MKAFLRYNYRNTRGFKKLVSSKVFDHYKPLAVSFIRDMSSDFDKRLATYSELGDVSGIKLEDVFPPKLRWLVKDKNLLARSNYLTEVEKRIDEFQGKETNLVVLVGTLFLEWVILDKLVEIYLQNIHSIYLVGDETIIPQITLADCGVGNSLLKFLYKFESVSDKTVDDWLNATFDAGYDSYFQVRMKRILMILLDMRLGE